MQVVHPGEPSGRQVPASSVMSGAPPLEPLLDAEGATAAHHATAESGAATRTRSGKKPATPLYTPEERARRDKTVWTLVQAILAPIQFLVFLISLGLALRYLVTGLGYEITTISIVAKTIILYVIMITGSIWEKVVFGKWLFAPSFFWEDVFSMLVLGLQTLYLFALTLGWWSPQTQVWIAVAAYGTYVINAGQFVWKLRVARLEAPPRPTPTGTPAESPQTLVGQTA
jgi:3-vinyl bacteriochlorophyllide hydratase